MLVAVIGPDSDHADLADGSDAEVRESELTEQTARDRTALFASTRPSALEFLVARGRMRSPRVLVQGVPLAITAIRSALAAIRVDAVVIDVADSPDEAVEICQLLQEQWPDIPVLALLCCARPTLPSHVRSMMVSGVTSFVDTRSEVSTLFDAIGDLGPQGMMYVRLHDREWMVETVVKASRHASVPPAYGLKLSQTALVRLVAQGLTNQEIGKVLHLAPSTVHHQIGELCAKLGVINRVALAAWAGAHGYLQNSASLVAK